MSHVTLRLLFLSALSTSVLSACGGGSSTLPPSPAPAASGSASTPQATPAASEPASGTTTGPAPAASTPTTGSGLAACPKHDIANTTAQDLACVITDKTYTGQTMFAPDAKTDFSLVPNNACAFILAPNGMAVRFSGQYDQGGSKSFTMWPGSYTYEQDQDVFTFSNSLKTAAVRGSASKSLLAAIVAYDKGGYLGCITKNVQ